MNSKLQGCDSFATAGENFQNTNYWETLNICFSLNTPESVISVPWPDKFNTESPVRLQPQRMLCWHGQMLISRTQLRLWVWAQRGTTSHLLDAGKQNYSIPYRIVKYLENFKWSVLEMQINTNWKQRIYWYSCGFPSSECSGVRDQSQSSGNFIGFNEVTQEVHLIFCWQFLALRKLFMLWDRGLKK